MQMVAESLGNAAKVVLNGDVLPILAACNFKNIEKFILGINTRVQFHATKRISIAFGSVVRFLVWFREMAVHIYEAIRDHACVLTHG